MVMMALFIAIRLILMFVFRLIASPLSYTVPMAGKKHFDLLSQLVLLLLSAALYLPRLLGVVLGKNSSDKFVEINAT